MSLLEAAANVGSGYVIALLTQVTVFPFFGIETTLEQDALITAIFTVVSLIRTYLWRRFFEVVWRR